MLHWRVRLTSLLVVVAAIAAFAGKGGREWFNYGW